MLAKLHYQRAANAAVEAERASHYRKAVALWHQALDKAVATTNQRWCSARISHFHKLAKRKGIIA